MNKRTAGSIAFSLTEVRPNILKSYPLPPENGEGWRVQVVAPNTSMTITDNTTIKELVEFLDQPAVKGAKS
jgi:hypothetical protein